MGALGTLSYADTLAAIGRFIATKQLSNICVMEFEQGIIVTGSVLYETGESYNRNVQTFVLCTEDLARMIKEA